MLISVEYAKAHMNETTILCRMRNVGIVLSNDDFENPLILNLFVESTILKLDSFISIGVA